MKKQLMIVVLLVAALTGCGMSYVPAKGGVQLQDAGCSVGSPQEQAACHRARAALLDGQAPAAHVAPVVNVNSPAVSLADANRQRLEDGAPAFARVQTVVPKDGHCGKRRTLFVTNSSDARFLEVRGDDLQVCDGSGLVPISVEQANGGVRTAFVIPPGVMVSYYFVPYRQLGNRRISTNGNKGYEIDVYDGSHQLSGWSPDSPAAHEKVLRDRLQVPFKCWDISGCNRHNKVTEWKINHSS